MFNLNTTLVAFGAAQGQRDVLPKMAVELAKAAKRGVIDEGDAMELYKRYFAASARTSARALDQRAPNIKVNASKLRQIIKAADPELLARVTHIRERLRFEKSCRSLYSCMVDACRMQLVIGRKLTDAQIKGLIPR